MKMLGFMIVMTLAYWGVASYAQSLISASEPCFRAAEAASFSAASPDLGAAQAGIEDISSSGAITLRGRWSEGEAYQVIETASAAVCAG